jgi:hypothetical protein
VRIRIPLILLLLLVAASSRAQHTNNEIVVQFAKSGQVSLASQGFYTSPTIWKLQYGLSTTGVQSFSIFAEHQTEARTHEQIFTPSTGEQAFNASITDDLSMTVIGFSTARTFYSASGFRLGGGLGLGYGFGVVNSSLVSRQTGERMEDIGCDDSWAGFFGELFLRVRYTLFVTGGVDVGLVATGRLWGYPWIGTLGTCADAYAGPDLHTLPEVGYLAGISVGF